MWYHQFSELMRCSVECPDGPGAFFIIGSRIIALGQDCELILLFHGVPVLARTPFTSLWNFALRGVSDSSDRIIQQLSKDLGILFVQYIIYWVNCCSTLGVRLGNYYYVHFPRCFTILPNEDPASNSVSEFCVWELAQAWNRTRNHDFERADFSLLLIHSWFM